MVMAKKEIRKEQNRQEILAAAEVVFARQGFHTTTMEEVAEECGWSKGTLYLHFKSKEDLFFSVIKEKVEKFSQALIDALERSQSLEQVITTMVDTQFQFFIENNEFFQLAIAEQGKVMHASSSGQRESLIEKQHEHIVYTSRILKEHLPTDTLVQPDTLARSITGAVNIHTLSWLLAPDSIDPDALKLEIIHLFLNGVIPHE